MTRQLNFFATGVEIKERLDAPAIARRIKLVRCGHYSSWRVPVLRAIHEVPGLGHSLTGIHIQDPDYLILPRFCPLRRQWFVPRGGRLTFAVDQGENPLALICSFGGLHGDRTLVAGRVATLHGSGRSGRFYEGFLAALTRGFERVGAYWVSPGAREFSRAGGRLVTMDARESREYDLAVDMPDDE